jgi:hypothetical protein
VVDERIQWFASRRNQEWTGTQAVVYSRIVGIELTGLKSSAAGSGVVKLEFQVDEKADADTPSGTITRTETMLQTVDNATQTFEQINYTFADPINMGINTGVLLRVARLGSAPEDTYDGADYLLCGEVTLNCVNDPAPSDNNNETITGIAVAAGVVTVTVAGIHDKINGELMRIKSVVSSGTPGSGTLAEKVNNKIFRIGGITASNQSTFTLSGIDGSAWTGTYTSGGLAEPVNRYQVSDDVIS